MKLVVPENIDPEKRYRLKSTGQEMSGAVVLRMLELLGVGCTLADALTMAETESLEDLRAEARANVIRQMEAEEREKIERRKADIKSAAQALGRENLMTLVDIANEVQGSIGRGCSDCVGQTEQLPDNKTRFVHSPGCPVVQTRARHRGDKKITMPIV